MSILLVMISVILIFTMVIFFWFIMKNPAKKGRYETDEYKPEKRNGFGIYEGNITLLTISVKLIILPLIVTFVTVSLLFLIIIAIETEIPVVSDIGKKIIDSYAVWSMQFIMAQLLVFMLWAIFMKIRITVENGVLTINEKEQNIRYYQVKKIFAQNTVIYLKTEKKLWILLPATVEGMRKYPRRDVLKKEQEKLENDIKVLEKFLLHGDGENKKFMWIKGLLFIFGGTFILLTMICIIMLIGKYYL